MKNNIVGINPTITTITTIEIIITITIIIIQAVIIIILLDNLVDHVKIIIKLSTKITIIIIPTKILKITITNAIKKEIKIIIAIVKTQSNHTKNLKVNISISQKSWKFPTILTKLKNMTIIYLS